MDSDLREALVTILQRLGRMEARLALLGPSKQGGINVSANGGGVCHADRQRALLRVARLGKQYLTVLEGTHDSKGSQEWLDWKETQVEVLEADLAAAASQLAALPDCSD